MVGVGVGAGVLDPGVQVVAGGVEGVQDGVPVFVRLSVQSGMWA